MRKGSHHSEEIKRKLSELNSGTKNPRYGKSAWNRGKPAWNKGKCASRETRRKLSEAHKGQYVSIKTRRKLSEVSKRHWQSPEYARKILAHKKPNSAECKLDAILQRLFPGEFALNIRAEIIVLGGKVPDFVNVNHKKQLIELWGDWWHRDQNPQERIDYFKQFGDWDTLIVWEHELKNEAILKQKLQTFVGEI